MAFGDRKTEIREAIKEMFGMEPDEVKTKLTKIDAVEAGVTAVKDLAAAQTTTLADIKESIGKISTPYSNQQQNQNQNQTNNQTRTEPSRWDEDAEAAYNDRTKPLVAGILDTRGMIARRNAIDSINALNPDLPWAKLDKEILERSKDATLEQKANEQFWKNVYYVCVGELRPEIERDRSSKSGRFALETATSSIVVDNNNEGKPEDKLSQVQLNAARKAGMSPADYAKELNSMTVWN